MQLTHTLFWGRAAQRDIPARASAVCNNHQANTACMSNMHVHKYSFYSPCLLKSSHFWLEKSRSSMKQKAFCWWLRQSATNEVCIKKSKTKPKKKALTSAMSIRARGTTSVQCGVGLHRPNPVASTAGQRNGSSNTEESRASSRSCATWN